MSSDNHKNSRFGFSEYELCMAITDMMYDDDFVPFVEAWSKSHNIGNISDKEAYFYQKSSTYDQQLRIHKKTSIMCIYHLVP